jgi:hypothetical protein
LIVVDGFEMNLGAIPIEEGFLCADPEWDALFRALIERLAEVSGSRVLITSQHPIASLPPSAEVTPVEVGPLLANEALSLVEEDGALLGLLRGGVLDRELAWRALEASAGNPIALKRLEDVAREGRSALESVLGLAPMPAAKPPEIEVAPGASAQPVVKTPPPEAPGARTPPPPGVRTPPPGPVSIPPTGPVSIPPMAPLPRHNLSESVAPSSPEEVTERAVAVLMQKLSPEERNLLWRITRAPAPMRPDLIKRLAELSP